MIYEPIKAVPIPALAQNVYLSFMESFLTIVCTVVVYLTFHDSNATVNTGDVVVKEKNLPSNHVNIVGTGIPAVSDLSFCVSVNGRVLRLL